MAVQEHFEGFDAPPEEFSKSAHKREAQAIRKLAEKIEAFGPITFNKLEFPDESIKEALVVARKLKKNSDEKRRQLQYVAKLMRSYDLDALINQIDNLGATPKSDPKALKMELLRENLIHGGTKALNEFTSLIYDTDRNKLRTLIKKAREELNSTLPDRPAARTLFKFLKAEIKRANVEIPDSLTKAVVKIDNDE